MPRTPSNRQRFRGFIPLPREKDSVSEIKVDGVSILRDYLSATFTKALCPDMGFFKIQLFNADGKFTDKYSGGETVQLFVDFSNGTTKRFEGVIDKVNNKQRAFEVLEIAGGHVSSSLLDITVTKEYTGDKTCDEILKELIDAYLTGYTYTNVKASTVKPNIKWSNKPFWSAVDDLCSVAVANPTTLLRRFDCYVDDSKDVHFFEENSIENNNEPLWKDTIIDLGGFGEQSTLAKNKILVYGNAGGLPIIRLSEDPTAQTSYGLKEQVIFDTDVNTIDFAQEMADVNLLQKDPQSEGEAKCFVLPTLNPGEKVWVLKPRMGIGKQIKVAKFTHVYPLIRTNVILEKKKDIPGLFRASMLRDLASEDILNPFEMTSSINLTFDDFTNIVSQTNVEIVDGKIKVIAGETSGTFTTRVFTQNNNITQVQLKVIGEKTTSAVFKIRTNNGGKLEKINPEALSNVLSGKDIEIKIDLNDADVEIDALALLIK